jgi:hypothetical protein
MGLARLMPKSRIIVHRLKKQKFRENLLVLTNDRLPNSGLTRSKCPVVSANGTAFIQTGQSIGKICKSIGNSSSRPRRCEADFARFTIG